jgi:hypothetical protein
MKGLLVEGRWGSPPGSFCELFEPLLGEFDRLFWLLDLQSGPFCIRDAFA